MLVSTYSRVKKQLKLQAIYLEITEVSIAAKKTKYIPMPFSIDIEDSILYSFSYQSSYD